MAGKIKEGIRKAMMAGIGLAAITKEKAEQIAKKLVKKGEASSKNVSELANIILEKAREGKKAVSSKVESTIKGIVDRMDVPTRKEIEDLKKAIKELKKKM